LVTKEDIEMSKYVVGDLVIISKKLTETGVWTDTKPRKAKIVEIKDTCTFGPAHVLEVNGERLGVCYWTSDIECKVDNRLYSDPDYLWKSWSDQ